MVYSFVTCIWDLISFVIFLGFFLASKLCYCYCTMFLFHMLLTLKLTTWVWKTSRNQVWSIWLLNLGEKRRNVLVNQIQNHSRGFTYFYIFIYIFLHYFQKKSYHPSTPSSISHLDNDLHGRTQVKFCDSICKGLFFHRRLSVNDVTHICGSLDSLFTLLCLFHKASTFSMQDNGTSLMNGPFTQTLNRLKMQMGR